MKHYMNIVAECPVQLIICVPWPMPRWRTILCALTTVMRSFDCRQKDIYSLDGLVAFPDETRSEKDLDFIERLKTAYNGNYDLFPTFWLYDWNAKRKSFRLVRAARDA